MNKTFIIVRTQFEGIHYYVNALEEVMFLRCPHRHIFYVEAEIEVFHNDRELEFIIVKRDLEKYLKELDVSYHSCEQIAELIQTYLKNRWPTPENIKRERLVSVKVFEDNENGVYLKDMGGKEV